MPVTSDRNNTNDLSVTRIGRIKSDDIDRKINSKINNDITLVSDKHSSILSFAKKNNIKHISFKASEHIADKEHTSKFIGYAEIPLSGSEKVKPGQNVNIKFDDFPYQFGMVRAKIDAISLVQSNKFYLATLSFPDSLNTNYKKNIAF